jgi:hypothetical protein
VGVVDERLFPNLGGGPGAADSREHKPPSRASDRRSDDEDPEMREGRRDDRGGERPCRIERAAGERSDHRRCGEDEASDGDVGRVNLLMAKQIGLLLTVGEDETRDCFGRAGGNSLEALLTGGWLPAQDWSLSRLKFWYGSCLDDRREPM